jgi:hypothetical protein
MNKNLLYYLLAITLVASCRKYDDGNAFDKSPDERINETLTAYQQAITGAQYGWNANLTTASGGTYRFYFSFNDSNRVQMYSDFDTTTSNVIKESSYRLKALQQPSLIFDTYSYIHILADPDASVNGGTYGSGLQSDFEFMIDSVTADSIKLTGRYYGSSLIMRKAAQGDRNVWATRQVTNGVLNFKNFGKFLYYFKRLNYRGTDYELQFDTTVRKVTVSWGSGAATQSVTTSYYFWANGIYFSDPIVNGANSIPGFSITSFTNGTAASQVMNVTVNGTAATIKGATAPINPDDKNAPARWRAFAGATDYYWISFDGFHKNGVDDALNLKSVHNDTAVFYFLLYRPNIGSVDALLTIYRDTVDNSLDAISGSWVTMNSLFGSSKVSFSEQTRTDVPWPASGPANDTRTQFFDGSGYYFVQTSAYSYDMVSASDATTWITWYWLF